jgi:hypothetical protein
MTKRTRLRMKQLLLVAETKTMATRFCFLAAVLSLSVVAWGGTFNGHDDYEVDGGGYYYVLNAPMLINGQTINGSNGAIWGITDSPYWQGVTGWSLDTWHQDGWGSDTAGLALTMKDNSQIVYDNNGIEGGDIAGYYTTVPHVVGYSMSNNFDWMYAGLFTLTSNTEVTDLIAYFNLSGYPSDFNPDFGWTYRMNIFSKVSGAPVNTGSFTGDVFSTDAAAGSFSWSYTGVNRPASSAPPGDGYTSGIPRQVWRLDYHLDTPMTLAAGEYYYSSDASVPEPGTFLLIGTALVGIGFIRRRAAKQPRSTL